MGLFGYKKRELPPLISDEELFPSVDYDTVLEWLLGLSAEEYSQVLQVAAIQRKANQESADVLGKPNKATTRINPPITKAPKDELAFLLDDEPKQSKPNSIKVKD